jgi:hypothetical protein
MADEATQEPADEAAKTATDQSTAGDEQDPAGAEALGDPGKKALDAMKQARNEARQQAQQAQTELAALKAAAEGREAEHKAELERQRIEADALGKANERILKAEIRAAAAGKLADPSDALRYLDLADFEVGADGDVDTAAVTGAIEALAKSKPYLAAQGGTGGTVFNSATSQREGNVGVKQLAEADLQGMSPQAVNAARAEGRLNDLLGIKTKP